MTGDICPKSAGQGVSLRQQQLVSPLSVKGSLLIAPDPGEAEEIDGFMNRVPFGFATPRSTELRVGRGLVATVRIVFRPRP